MKKLVYIAFVAASIAFAQDVPDPIEQRREEERLQREIEREEQRAQLRQIQEEFRKTKGSNVAEEGLLPEKPSFTDTPPVLDTKGESLTWKAGCESGLVLDCYCKIAPQQEGSVYSVLQRVRLTVGNDGRIESAELLPDRVRIKADCKRMNPAKL